MARPTDTHPLSGWQRRSRACILCAVVSEKERTHFRRIAAAEDDLNRESLARDARRSPGVNIALGLALSEFATTFGADLSRPDEVSPASLWRSRGRHSPAQR